MLTATASRFEAHVLACLVFGVIGDAMGTPTENLEPAEIEQRFGWVDWFEGDGTDDTIMRDLVASALIRTGGYADADHWAEEWRDRHDAIFASKGGHDAEFELGHGDRPRRHRQCRQPEGRGCAGNGNRKPDPCDGCRILSGR